MGEKLLIDTDPLTSDALLVAGLLDYEETYAEVNTRGDPSNGTTIYDDHGVLGHKPNSEGAISIHEDDSHEDIVVSRLEEFA